MPGPLREPVITLAGGPWDRQAFLRHRVGRLPPRRRTHGPNTR